MTPTAQGVRPTPAAIPSSSPVPGRAASAAVPAGPAPAQQRGYTHPSRQAHLPAGPDRQRATNGLQTDERARRQVQTGSMRRPGGAAPGTDGQRHRRGSTMRGQLFRAAWTRVIPLLPPLAALFLAGCRC